MPFSSEKMIRRYASIYMIYIQGQFEIFSDCKYVVRVEWSPGFEFFKVSNMCMDVHNMVQTFSPQKETGPSYFICWQLVLLCSKLLFVECNKNCKSNWRTNNVCILSSNSKYLLICNALQPFVFCLYNKFKHYNVFVKNRLRWFRQTARVKAIAHSL